MIALKLIAEGLGLGFLPYLICAIGIRNGAVGMVHLFCSARNRRRGRLGAQQEYMTGLGVSAMKGSYRLSEGKEEFVKA